MFNNPVNICQAITASSRLYVPGQQPHLFDAGVHKGLNKLALENQKQG